MSRRVAKTGNAVSDIPRYNNQSAFKKVLDFDVWLTKIFAVSASSESRCGFLRPFMRLLEYSGDGFLWLPVVIIWNIVSHEMEMHHKLMNMLIVLIVDAMVVGCIKMIVRRKRPTHCKKDMMITVPVDKYSFPSGHTTRATSMALFIMAYFELSLPYTLAVYAWPALISVSRVMLGRHHVLDVLCGVLIGVSQFYVAVNFLWLSKETCESIMRPIQEMLHI